MRYQALRQNLREKTSYMMMMNPGYQQRQGPGFGTAAAGTAAGFGAGAWALNNPQTLRRWNAGAMQASRRMGPGFHGAMRTPLNQTAKFFRNMPKGLPWIGAAAGLAATQMGRR